MKILLAADGSEFTRKAARFVAQHVGWLKDKPEIIVHHVRPKFPFPGGVGGSTIERYEREEADKALAVAAGELTAAGVAHETAYTVGDVAEEVAAVAKRRGVDIVVVGSHGHGALAKLALGSVATKLLAVVEAPVLVVR